MCVANGWNIFFKQSYFVIFLIIPNLRIFVYFTLLGAPYSVLARHKHRNKTNTDIYIPAIPRLSNKQKMQKVQKLMNKSFDVKNNINYKEINDNQLAIPPQVTNVSSNFLNNLFETTNLKLNDHIFESPSDYEFFKSNVMTDNQKSILISNSKQLSTEWKDERRLRITASKCYEFYTYCNTVKTDIQWAKKINNLIHPKQYVSKHMRYGIDTEQFALDAYIRDSNTNVTKMGLVVHPTACWLGCSPDGVDIENEILLEIKCPNLGQELNLNDLQKNLPYLDKTFQLKTKHIYYGQVQLNLFILNFKMCHFLIYSKAEDKCLCVEVAYDDHFVRNIMIPKLAHTYFTRILPALNNNNNKIRI